ATYPDRFTSVEYDVRVGQGIEPPAGLTPALNKMAEALTRQRIDAIGESEGGKTLVEITPSAGTDSLGQLLVYKELWMMDHEGGPEPALMLVTDFTRPDIRSVAALKGVEIIVI
ncbi:MAG: hypothetical protein ACREIQ_04110, partial [Nitrospiria bacterium]